MTITHCGAEQAEALSAIHMACFPTGWSSASIAAFFDTPGTYAFAESNGMIICRVAGEQADLITIAVVTPARGKGLASALLSAAMAHARKLGAEGMFLEVGERNSAAVRLYENAGFSTLTRRKGYYASGEDALLMSKSLT